MRLLCDTTGRFGAKAAGFTRKQGSPSGYISFSQAAWFGMAGIITAMGEQYSVLGYLLLWAKPVCDHVSCGEMKVFLQPTLPLPAPESPYPWPGFGPQVFEAKHVSFYKPDSTAHANFLSWKCPSAQIPAEKKFLESG